MTRSVLLIVPPQEYGYGYINDFFWQEGILYLASFLFRQFGTNIDVTICDGNRRTLAECEEMIDNRTFDVVGFHSIDHTRTAALSLARRAVRRGCQTILFGGAGAIFGPGQYIEALFDVDREVLVGACTDSGEHTLYALLTGRRYEDVPNLVYREGRGHTAYVKRSPISAKRPDRSAYLASIPYEAYTEILGYLREQLSRSDYPYLAPTYSGLSHEGCPHRVYRGGKLIKGCSFCAIPAQKLAARDPEGFWERFASLDKLCVEAVGVGLRSIKDWGDSLTPHLLRNLIEARPQRYDGVSYSCYLSIADMTRGLLDALRGMNCWSVYMGLDGTSDKGLDFLEKGYSATEYWERLEMLSSSYDFKIELGIILGVKGETQESLARSVEAAKRISDMFGDRVIVIQGNMLVPMPGSSVFDSLRADAEAKNDPNPIGLDVQGRIRVWLDNFTNVSFEDCSSAQNEIERISPRRHSYSLPRGQ